MREKALVIAVTVTLVAALVLIVAPVVGGQPPPLPGRFFGSVQLDGASVPDGTTIAAVIEGDTYTTTTPSAYGGSTYTLQITPPAGGYPGGTPIAFSIGGIPADQQGVWEAGGNFELNLSASPGLVLRALAMQVDGCGTTAPVPGTHEYEEGTVVAISALPCPGWVFAHWTGDVASSSSLTTTVTMNSDKTVSANFEEIQARTLTVISGIGGSVTTPGEGSFEFNEGTVVALTAEPSPGWAFQGWSGDVADPAAASTTVAMDDDKQVVATFVPAATAGFHSHYALRHAVTGQLRDTGIHADEPAPTPQGGWKVVQILIKHS